MSDESLSDKKPTVSKPKRGRPKKSDILAKMPGNRGQVGRPKGDAGRMAELKARLLAAGTGERVIDKIIQIAMDDSHSGQMAALKMVADRAIPLSAFEKDKEGNRPQITINVTGMVDVGQSNDVIDMESEE
jgi:hypothetical protein